jgi:hypothetical protein
MDSKSGTKCPKLSWNISVRYLSHESLSSIKVYFLEYLRIYPLLNSLVPPFKVQRNVQLRIGTLRLSAAFPAHREGRYCCIGPKEASI